MVDGVFFYPKKHLSLLKPILIRGVKFPGRANKAVKTVVNRIRAIRDATSKLPKQGVRIRIKAANKDPAMKTRVNKIVIANDCILKWENSFQTFSAPVLNRGFFMRWANPFVPVSMEEHCCLYVIWNATCIQRSLTNFLFKKPVGMFVFSTRIRRTTHSFKNQSTKYFLAPMAAC